MAGTSKRGAHSGPTTRHEFIYLRPAGVRKTFRTAQDATTDPTVDQENMHGDGSTAPICVVDGQGSIEWGLSVAQAEYESHIVAVAAAAGIPVMGTGGLLFNYVKTSEVDGLPKSVNIVENCKIGGASLSIDPAGNRRELSGMATNEKINGARQFQEAQ